MGRDMYRERILDHYRNPRKYGELEDADCSHTGENPSCGDEIAVDINLDSQGETIETVRFRGEGCAISIAAASMLSEEIEGKSVDFVVGLDTDEVVDMLGIELTPMRIKCAMLAEKVAEAALEEEN